MAPFNQNGLALLIDPLCGVAATAGDTPKTQRALP
jgi:hypothetical protein